jgi:hypothetical protein
MGGGATTDARPLAAAVVAFAAGMAMLAARRAARAWRAAAKDTALVCWVRRAGLFCWAAVAVLAAVALLRRTPGWFTALLAAFELALLARLLAGTSETGALKRAKAMAGPLGWMVSAALAPALYNTVVADVVLPQGLFYLFCGGLVVGLLGSVQGLGSTGGSSWSWGSGSGGSSWSSGSGGSSWSSSSSSSSSSFSGGGGSSGGGGASSSW